MEHNEAQAAGLVTNQLLDAAGSRVMGLAGADVGRNREDLRRKRLWRLAVWAAPFPALARRPRSGSEPTGRASRQTCC